MLRGSLGTVTTQHAEIEGLFTLESGAVLPGLTIAYETYGKLNRDKTNAILICHALSGDAHVAGFHEGDNKPGWWDAVIGPGKAFDTDLYYIICSNVIGGCKGSTGPSSINPATGKAYGATFPVVTICDMVNAQKLLLDFLGIPELYAVPGGSMGGMQALQWTVSFPDLIKKVIVIATTGYRRPSRSLSTRSAGKRSSPIPTGTTGTTTERRYPPAASRSPGWSATSRTSLTSRCTRSSGGHCRARSRSGLISRQSLASKSYLHYQGDTFTKRFDANSYLYITKAIDYFDLTKDGSLATGLSGTKAAFLVMSVSSDWLYPPYQSEEIVTALSANERELQVLRKSGPAMATTRFFSNQDSSPT